MPLQKQCAHFLLEVEPDQFCISLSDPNRIPLKWPKPSGCSSIHPTSSRLLSIPHRLWYAAFRWNGTTTSFCNLQAL